MQAGRTFALSIASGMVAAVLLASMNYLVAGPYVSELEFDYVYLKLAEGLYIEEELDLALQQQHFWRIGFPIVMGIGGGLLVATVFTRKGNFGGSGTSGASGASGAFIMILAVVGAAWFSLYVMPTLKYPLVPDVLFDPVASSEYTVLFAGYSASSGLAALGTAIGFSRTGRKGWYFGAAGVYLAIVAGLYMAFPDYLEAEFYDRTVLEGWRSATAAGVTAFWFTLGILAGVLLERQEKKLAGIGN